MAVHAAGRASLPASRIFISFGGCRGSAGASPSYRRSGPTPRAETSDVLPCCVCPYVREKGKNGTSATFTIAYFIAARDTKKQFHLIHFRQQPSINTYRRRSSRIFFLTEQILRA